MNNSIFCSKFSKIITIKSVIFLYSYIHPHLLYWNRNFHVVQFFYFHHFSSMQLIFFENQQYLYKYIILKSEFIYKSMYINVCLGKLLFKCIKLTGHELSVSYLNKKIVNFLKSLWTFSMAKLSWNFIILRIYNRKNVWLKSNSYIQFSFWNSR